MSWWNSILVVDDDPDLLRAYKDALEVDGHSVVLARDGYEALRLLRQGLRPAVILLDLRMPRLDAWAFREQQRKAPALAGIPVIVLYSQAVESEAMMALDVQGFLQKPVDLDVLLRAVAPHVARGGQASHPS